MRKVRILVVEQQPNGELVRHLGWHEISEAAYHRDLERRKRAALAQKES